MYSQSSSFGGMQGAYASQTPILQGAVQAAQAQVQMDQLRDAAVEERRIERELGMRPAGGPTFGDETNYAGLLEQGMQSPGGTVYNYQSPGGNLYSARSPGGSYQNQYHNMISRTHSNRRRGSTVGQEPSGNQPGHPFYGNGFTGSMKDPQNVAAYESGLHNRRMADEANAMSPVTRTGRAHPGEGRRSRSGSFSSLNAGFMSPGGTAYGMMSPGGTQYPYYNEGTWYSQRSPGGTYGGRSRGYEGVQRSAMEAHMLGEMRHARGEIPVQRRGMEAPFSTWNTGMPAGNQPGHPFTGNAWTGGFANPVTGQQNAYRYYVLGEHNREMQNSPMKYAFSGEGNPNRQYRDIVTDPSQSLPGASQMGMTGQMSPNGSRSRSFVLPPNLTQ